MIHYSLKKLAIAVVLGGSLLLSLQISKIKIDIDRTAGAIDPMRYGVFMEPIVKL
jgi:hypothetical protein